MSANDKSWLLNPTAIKAAKACIQAVEEELGVRLKLSHPNFLEMLHEYAELTDAVAIQAAYAELRVLAGDQAPAMRASRVVNLPARTASSPSPIPTVTERADAVDEEVEYYGRRYPRWSEGKEFKGLYRGQPKYA